MARRFRLYALKLYSEVFSKHQLLLFIPAKTVDVNEKNRILSNWVIKISHFKDPVD